jgi:DNA-directed RNA polymerase specialized sigma24 family protein
LHYNAIRDSIQLTTQARFLQVFSAKNPKNNKVKTEEKTMAANALHYEEWIAQWHREIYGLCLAATLHAKTAWELAFQACLRLGAAPEGMDEAAARKTLYRAAATVCQAYRLKKARRSPRKKALAAGLGAMQGKEALLAFLRLPFLCKLSAYIIHIAGFAPGEAGEMLGMRPARAKRLAERADMAGVAEALAALPFDEALQQEWLDQIVLRFAERSVGFETRAADLRYRIDRAVPYVALVIFVLFAVGLYMAR